MFMVRRIVDGVDASGRLGTSAGMHVDGEGTPLDSESQNELTAWTVSVRRSVTRWA